MGEKTPSPFPKVEAALAWAAQQGYVYAKEAAAELGAVTEREMVCFSDYYNAWEWRPKA